LAAPQKHTAMVCSLDIFFTETMRFTRSGRRDAATGGLIALARNAGGRAR
jgi:hypothetical protein